MADTTATLNPELLDQEIPSPGTLLQELPPEEEKKQQTGQGLALLTVALLSRLGNPQIMEEDEKFEKSLKEVKQKWLNDNPGKGFTSKEGVEFLEQSLDKAREHFRARSLETRRGRRKLKRYDKNFEKIKNSTYRNPLSDPLFRLFNEKHVGGREVKSLIDAKYKLLSKTNPAITRDDVAKMVWGKVWDDFAKEYPDKTSAYASDKYKDREIQKGVFFKSALKQALERAKVKDQESQPPASSSQIPPTDYATKEALFDYYLERGKEVKLTEDKIHRAKDEPTVSEATQILEGPKESKGAGLVDIHGNPLYSRGVSSPSSASEPQKIEGAVDLNELEKTGIRKFIPIRPITPITVTDSEREQMETVQSPFEVRTQRRTIRLTRGAINFSNKAMRGGKNAIGFAKNAAKIGQMGARVVPLLMNPVTWIVIGILIVILLLILILLVIFGVFGGPAELPFIFGLRLEKSANPKHVDNGGGKEITYTITAAYSGDKDIVITDRIPPGTQFVKAGPGTQGKEYRFENGAVTWRLNDNNATGTKQIPGDCAKCMKTEKSFEFSVTVITLKSADDSIIENKAVADIVGSGAIDISSKTLAEYFAGSALQYKVPVALLKAIASTESQVLGYAEGEVAQFSAKQWWSGRIDSAINLSGNDPLIIRGYGYNTCQPSYGAGCAPGSDVRGTTQFEINTWNGLKGSLTFTDGHDPDRRYVADAIFGQGAHVRNIANQYESRYHFSQSNTDWTEEQVKAVARTYCGGNPDADVNVKACAQGGKSYDQVVWGYYLEFKGKN
ncbi:MAG: DUF11 domain-containing protein [Patescibacteria group bacterium]|nr:DUF11 domain-containing protein [Patescibacteria group bacterium]